MWPRNPFMAELAQQTQSTLREFMDKADNYVNVEDTLYALIVLRKYEMKGEDKDL